MSAIELSLTRYNNAVLSATTSEQRRAAIHALAECYINHVAAVAVNEPQEELLQKLILMPGNLTTSPIFLWMYQNPLHRAAIGVLLDMIGDHVMRIRQPEIVMADIPVRLSLVFRVDFARLPPVVRRLHHTIFNSDASGQTLLSAMLNAGDTELAQLLPNCELHTQPYHQGSSLTYSERL